MLLPASRLYCGLTTCFRLVVAGALVPSRTPPSPGLVTQSLTFQLDLYGFELLIG